MASAARHAALLIALGGKPKGGPPAADGDDERDPKDGEKGDDMESSAVDDMWDAIQSKDKASFGDALKRYVQACVTKAGDDEEGDEHEDY